MLTGRSGSDMQERCCFNASWVGEYVDEPKQGHRHLFPEGVLSQDERRATPLF
ncbi:hypothetical protein ES703_102221 [subsurface metagenome]